MKFTTAVIAATAASIVSASPCGKTPDDTKINDNDIFTVLTIRSGSDLQYGQLQAANSRLLVRNPQQNASCSEDVNYASFFLQDGNLFLNTANPPQQVFVNRSGMAQGIVGFTTGVQPLTDGAEQTTFAIDENSNLVFRSPNGMEYGFQACPSSQGGYSVWLTGVTNPAGSSGCLGFVSRAIKADNPVSCSYTS
ncbi:hypothetical protein ACN47E_009633 [Coniothyrium glycines]